MIPTLKEIYEKQQLDINEASNKLLHEAIDQGVLDQVSNALKEIEQVMQSPGSEKLTAISAGIQEANKDLVKLISGSGKSILPKRFTALGKTAIFTTSIIRLFTQLPQIVKIVKGSMGAEMQKGWDKTKPLTNLLDSETRAKLPDILKKALTPKGITGGLFFPYASRDDIAIQMLDLSFEELSKFAVASQKLHPPRDEAIATLMTAIKQETPKEEQGADTQDMGKASEAPEESQPAEEPKAKSQTSKGSLEKTKSDLTLLFSAKINKAKKSQEGKPFDPDSLVPELVNVVIGYIKNQQKR